MILQDEILISDFKEGSDIAFVSLYNRYKHLVFAYCLKLLGDSDTAKDIVQGVFLKVYEHRSQLRQPTSFKSWILIIARNDCLTYLRRARLMTSLHEGTDNDTLSIQPPDVDTKEEAALVARAVEQLGVELREVIVLREYQDLSYKEISCVIGLPESTVKSRLFMARQQLYERLKPIFAERRER